ncbi:MAG: thioredoxin family protein [Candidatus Kariarchaeaceae archaeon]|jgi:hypothetical protein
MNRQDTFLKMFEAGVSYERYIELTLNEKVKDRMTGHWQAAEELINNLDPQKLNQLNRKLKVLCIGENWCGDCANGIPVIARLAESLDNWEFVIAPKTPFEEDLRWVERPTRSYRLLADLQAQKLPKEEYMAKYKSMPELKVPSLTGEILKELIEAADRATAMTQILPTKRRQ